MNVLITGGAGYVGSSLVKRLNAHKKVKKIVIFDNLSRAPLAFFFGKERLEKVNFIQGDILDSYSLEKALLDIDVVYHLAAFVQQPFNYFHNVQYEHINQWGTLNLIRCLQSMKRRLKHLIFLSSASVYGLRMNIDENEEAEPSNAYGMSKLQGEKYVELLRDMTDVSIIRSANVFGFNTSVRLDSVLNNFIFYALVNRRILIHGKGEQTRPFIELGNLVEELIGAIDGSILEDGYKLVMDFNASLNEIVQWLTTSHIRDLEYSYLNQNTDYSGQSFMGKDDINKYLPTLDNTFKSFQENIRIRV